MSKHDEANLILKLYELRREPTMRAAREWFIGFNPQTVADVNNAMFSENGAHLRMVTSYWDMAAALVNHGAIGHDIFNDTNGEHLLVFSKMEAVLPELRAAWGPDVMAHLEKLIDKTSGGRDRVARMKEMMKMMGAEMAKRQSASA